MKTLLKVLVAAAVLNATVRTAAAAWSYYQFKDAAQQTVLFGFQATPQQLHGLIMRRAAELDVPIVGSQVEVRRDGPRTVVRAEYSEPVKLLPFYEYPIDWSFTVDALAFGPGPPAAP